MNTDTDLEARLVALETTVQEMGLEIVALRKALGERQPPLQQPVLRSHGMLDRPKPGR